MLNEVWNWVSPVEGHFKILSRNLPERTERSLQKPVSTANPRPQSNWVPPERSEENHENYVTTSDLDVEIRIGGRWAQDITTPVGTHSHVQSVIGVPRSEGAPLLLHVRVLSLPSPNTRVARSQSGHTQTFTATRRTECSRRLPARLITSEYCNRWSAACSYLLTRLSFQLSNAPSHSGERGYPD